ncbi:MAG: thermonuclease family protein [Clostridiaceae bacterium]
MFENRKYRKIGIIALLISAIFAAGCSGIKQDTTSQSETAGQSGFEKAVVSRVVDGDTVVLSDGRRVRFIGLDSPEYTTKIEPYGKEASNFTKDRLTGITVYLEKDVSETDKYGRLLRYVWLSVPEGISDSEIRSKMFNAILVLEGYAQSNTYPPDVKYQQYLTKYNAEARKADKGLWNQDSRIQN